jgi:tetratricopeptide (TPR) repeat protein
VLSAAAGAESDATSIPELLEFAEAELAEGEPKRALKAFEKAASEPDFRSQALTGVARVHLKLGREDKALAAAESALAAAPDAVEQARVHGVIGRVRWTQALRLLIEVERLSSRPGKKKPTYGEQLDEYLTLAESAHRTALTLTEGQSTGAWLDLVELLTNMGRLGAARAELLAFFESDPEGRSAASEELEYLECIGDVADLGEVVHPTDEGVTAAVRQFHPSPRLGELEDPGPVRVVGVVDEEGRFHCVRILPLGTFPDEARDVYMPVLSTWRFEPALRDGSSVPAFYASTVTAFERPW